MAEFEVNTERYDPYRSYLFQIIVEGQVVAGVSKVGALKRSTEVVSHREGNSIAHQLHSPGTTSHEPIVLERGVTHDMSFMDWADSVFSNEGFGGISLANFRRELRINLMNLQGRPVISYIVHRCWPSEFVALPELDANNNAVAIQSLTLQNEGWEIDPEVKEELET